MLQHLQSTDFEILALFGTLIVKHQHISDSAHYDPLHSYFIEYCQDMGIH